MQCSAPDRPPKSCQQWMNGRPPLNPHLCRAPLRAAAPCRDGKPVDRYEGLLSGQDLDMRLRSNMMK